MGYEVINIPLTADGRIDVCKFNDCFNRWSEVSFASVMLANNETGMINDIKNLSTMLRKHRIPFHCDAVQALGKMRIDAYDLGVDYMSFSGHKVHVPKGIGALFAKNESCLSRLIHGTQEHSVRGGTENVAFIVAFGKAIEDAYSDEISMYDERIAKMYEFCKIIEESILNSGHIAFFNGSNLNRLVNTLNVGFEGIDALKLSFILESRGIYVSNGAACNTDNPIQSHVLKAMKSPAYENGAIRISLSEFTEKIDVEYFLANLHDSIRKLKEGASCQYL
jgi:cysteine desulfurase